MKNEGRKNKLGGGGFGRGCVTLKKKGGVIPLAKPLGAGSSVHLAVSGIAEYGENHDINS